MKKLRKPKFLFTALVLLSLGGLGQILDAQDSKSSQNAAVASPPEFKPELIGVYVRVEDMQGRFVGNLTKEHFHLVVDGKPRELESAYTHDSLPCSVVLLMDWSGSRRKELPRGEIKPAVEMFRSILGTNCTATAALFADRVIPIAGPTRDPSEVESMLRKASADLPKGSTPFYDATQWAAKKLSRAPGYRVAIIVSDGEDNSSGSKPSAAIQNVRNANATFFFLNLNSLDRHESRKSRKEAELFIQQVIDSTGGEAFAIRNEADMEAGFLRIQDRLSHFYSLSFWTLPEDAAGKLHSLRFEIDPKDLRVRAPDGFVP